MEFGSCENESNPETNATKTMIGGDLVAKLIPRDMKMRIEEKIVVDCQEKIPH